MSKVIDGIEIFIESNGLIVKGKAFGSDIPTTAGRFAPGATILGVNGKSYRNSGTTASVVWQDEDSIATDEIADGAVTAGKLASTLDISSKTVTLPATSVTAGMLAATLDLSSKTLTLPNTSVGLANLTTGIKPKLIVTSANEGITTSDEWNQGLYDSVIVLANGLKGTMNVHYADFGASGEEHKAEDTAIAAANATDQASCITLAKAIQDSYVAHNADSILASDWVYHQAQGTDRALTSAVNPTNLKTLKAVLNDIKAKLDLHMADAASHTVGDSPAVTAADAANTAVVGISAAGADTGDLVFYNVIDDGTNNVSIASAVAGGDYLTVTFSGDPVEDTIFSWITMRVAS